MLVQEEEVWVAVVVRNRSLVEGIPSLIEAVVKLSLKFFVRIPLQVAVAQGHHRYLSPSHTLCLLCQFRDRNGLYLLVGLLGLIPVNMLLDSILESAKQRGKGEGRKDKSKESYEHQISSTPQHTLTSVWTRNTSYVTVYI